MPNRPISDENSNVLTLMYKHITKPTLWEQIIGVQAKLRRDETQDRLRDHLAGTQQATRIPKGAKLKREAQLVFRTPSGTDVRDVIIGQRVVTQKGRLVSGQIEESGTLARRQDSTMGHGSREQVG